MVQCETCTAINVQLTEEYLDWLNEKTQDCPDVLCVNCPYVGGSNG